MTGKLWQVVRYVTERNQEGVLLPHDFDTKSSRPVMEMLCKKYLDAKELSGAEGLSGLDFSMAHNLLLRFVTASANLCNTFAKLAT